VLLELPALAELPEPPDEPLLGAFAPLGCTAFQMPPDELIPLPVVWPGEESSEYV
jgi:hypothetical protein